MYHILNALTRPRNSGAKCSIDQEMTLQSVVEPTAGSCLQAILGAGSSRRNLFTLEFSAQINVQNLILKVTNEPSFSSSDSSVITSTLVVGVVELLFADRSMR